MLNGIEYGATLARRGLFRFGGPEIEAVDATMSKGESTVAGWSAGSGFHGPVARDDGTAGSVWRRKIGFIEAWVELNAGEFGAIDTDDNLRVGAVERNSSTAIAVLTRVKPERRAINTTTPAGVARPNPHRDKRCGEACVRRILPGQAAETGPAGALCKASALRRSGTE